jgi:hypothetical protein
MADNYLSGISGYVKLGATAYSFNKWECEFETKQNVVNNFTGAGYQQIVSGITKAQLTLEMQGYNEGNCALTCGNSYTFHCGFASGPIELVVTGNIRTITASNDVDGTPSIKVMVDSNGSMTAAIV